MSGGVLRRAGRQESGRVCEDGGVRGVGVVHREGTRQAGRQAGRQGVRVCCVVLYPRAGGEH